MAAETYTGEDLPIDGSSKRFAPLRADDSGTARLVAQEGVNLITVNGKRVANAKVQVGTELGMGLAIGAKGDAAASTDDGTFSHMSLVKRLLVRFSTLISSVADGVSTLGTTSDAPVYDDVADATAMARLRGMLDHLGGLIATIGTTSGAAVITDANGTVQQYLRGLVALIANRFPSTLTGSGHFKVAVWEGLPAGTNNIGDVDIASAIPAGTNNIGDVDIASIAAGDNNIGNVDIASELPAGTQNIGDVDVASIVPGTGTTNLGKAEDQASADGHVGIGALAVRKATPVNTSGTDGDYEFLQISAGRLWTSAVIDTALPAGTNNIGDVDVLSSALPTGASTEATLAAVNTKLGAALPLPTGAATSALQGTTNTSLSAIDTKLGAALPLPTGAASAANQASELTLVGAVTETAPASDTASSGLNGRLQRIAQRLTSLIGQIPATLGPATPAASLAVTQVANTSALATVVTVGTSAVALPASALANRKRLVYYNNGSAICYVGGSGVTTSTGVPVGPGQFYSDDLGPSAVLYAISAAASQNGRVVEAA